MIIQPEWQREAISMIAEREKTRIVKVGHRINYNFSGLVEEYDGLRTALDENPIVYMDGEKHSMALAFILRDVLNEVAE